MKTRYIILFFSIGLVLLSIYFLNNTKGNENFQKEFAIHAKTLEKINEIAIRENYNELKINLFFNNNGKVIIKHLDTSSTHFEEMDLKKIESLKMEMEFYGIAKSNKLNFIIMDMFIGNGYGYLKTDKKSIEYLMKNFQYGINGLQIKSIIELENDWYRIGFT